MKMPIYQLGDVIVDLADAAVQAARENARRRRARQIQSENALTRRGWALHPGRDTPLWNELVRRANRRLQRRGSKAQLARLLGLPRQRLQDCLKAQTAMLDAERALLLLAWLAAGDRGRELGTPPLGVK